MLVNHRVIEPWLTTLEKKKFYILNLMSWGVAIYLYIAHQYYS